MKYAFAKTNPLTLLYTAIGGFFLATTPCEGQGTVHVMFEGPPPQPPGTSFYVQQYFESGIWFRPLGEVGPGNGFGRSGPSRSSFLENGTAYLHAGLTDSLAFGFTNEALFEMTSVDLAEFSTLYQEPLTVPFVGYKQDGSTVMTSFTTDGIIDGTGPLTDFETFNFGPEFSNLFRVEVPTYGWSLDNLYISVPEPTALVLLLCGGCLLFVYRKKFRWRRGSEV